MTAKIKIDKILRGFVPIGMMGLKKTEFKAHISALIFLF